MSYQHNRQAMMNDGSWAWDNPAPGNVLSVADVERLAKAGVAIKFEDIRYQIKQDDQVPPQMGWGPRSFEDSFWDRWRRANVQRASMYGDIHPYGINASQHGDTIYVFVQPHDQPPFVIEDVAALYPSDALMAKLALLEKIKP